MFIKMLLHIWFTPDMQQHFSFAIFILKLCKEIFSIPIPCLICYHILKVDIQIAEKLFFRGKKSFDKIEKIEYSIRRELATECVSMGVDAEERVRKRDSA